MRGWSDIFMCSKLFLYLLVFVSPIVQTLHFSCTTNLLPYVICYSAKICAEYFNWSEIIFWYPPSWNSTVLILFCTVYNVLIKIFISCSKFCLRRINFLKILPVPILFLSIGRENYFCSELNFSLIHKKNIFK